LAKLRNAGVMVPDGHLAHTSPLGWEHIGLPGDFPWDQAALLPAERRPLDPSPRAMAA